MIPRADLMCPGSNVAIGKKQEKGYLPDECESNKPFRISKSVRLI